MARPSLLLRLGVLVALASATIGATDAPSLYYRTYVNETFGSPLGTAGELAITIQDGSRIDGWWRSESGSAQQIPVRGEVRDHHAIFDIGTRFHVNAEMKPDGSLRGSAVSDASNQPLTFTATREASP